MSRDIHTADTEYGGMLRVRLYGRATIKRRCSTTRVVPVGVTFACKGDEKERERQSGEKRGKGRGERSGNGHEQLYYFRDVTTSVEDPESSVQKR